MEIKRIQAIHTLEKRLGELRALIPVYKARNPTYEHVLAKQIIDIDLQLIEAKSKKLYNTFTCTTYICSTFTITAAIFSAATSTAATSTAATSIASTTTAAIRNKRYGRNSD